MLFTDASIVSYYICTIYYYVLLVIIFAQYGIESRT